MSVFVMHFSSHPLQRAAPRAGALQGGRLAFAIGVHTALNPAASKVWGRYVSISMFQGVSAAGGCRRPPTARADASRLRRLRSMPAYWFFWHWGARAWRGMGQRSPSAWRRHGAQDGNPVSCSRSCAACACPLPRGCPVSLSSPIIVAAWRGPPRGAPAGPRCPGRMRSGRPFKVADACCGLVHAQRPSGEYGLRSVARAFLCV